MPKSKRSIATAASVDETSSPVKATVAASEGDSNPLAAHPEMSAWLGRVHHGDCIEQMRALPDGCVQLAFADPPFNIGYEYDVYNDRLERDHYLDWTKRWMTQVRRVVAPGGAFWLAIGDEYAAELKLIARDVGFHCRSWVIWYYTFGVHCRNKFTRSHAHVFHFVTDPERFVFHADAVSVPSARQLVYGDARANPKGRTPDDTWILRPQDCPNSLTPDEDTWYFPRVAGTFKERAGFHGCQMPEQLLGRILKVSSSPGDIVLDPFAGSASTLVVAKKLDRRFLGFDLSEEYAQMGNARLQEVASGDALVGAADPKRSAPSTSEGIVRDPNSGRRSPASKRATAKTIASPMLPLFEDTADVSDSLEDAFRDSHRDWSVERVIVDPWLNEQFQSACDARAVSLSPAERNRGLLSLRAHGRLAEFDIASTQRTAFHWSEVDATAFASEIAWRRIAERYAASLNEILCDPELAKEFDRYAMELASGIGSLQARWTALMLRREWQTRPVCKEASHPISDATSATAEAPPIPVPAWNLASERIAAEPHEIANLPTTPSAYALIALPTGQPLYIGWTWNLRTRLQRQCTEGWLHRMPTESIASTEVWFQPITTGQGIGWHTRNHWVDRAQPLCNVLWPAIVSG